MIRRSLLNAGFIVLATLLGGIDIVRPAYADDDKKDSKKDEKKKIEMPKLPEGSKPVWDLKAVEEKFTIIKGDISKEGLVYFLVELKEDMADSSSKEFKVIYTDSDKVKLADGAASCTPRSGKKGDRVRLYFHGQAPATWKELWIKAAKIQFVDK